jgi:hypothetical protein
MIKPFRRILAAAGLLLCPVLMQTTSAGDFQGTELTYQCIAPRMYQVILKAYRDCSGVAPLATITLNLKATGCNPGRNYALTKVATAPVGDPYCPQMPVVCNTNSPNANYEEVTYTGTVTFTAAEEACPNWILSITDCCRAEVANLNNAPGTNLYSEAYLNLKAGLNNNSPQFGSLVSPYLNRNNPILISAGAVDQDGDSLVYSLKDPLSGPATPIAYKTYGPEIIFNSDTTKWATIHSGTFSTAFPLHSYTANWSQPMPVTPNPAFIFDPKTGSMAFTPTRYKPNTYPVLGQNKYVTVVQVDEYRKVNGTMTRIGYVRRDMTITIVDSGPNKNPGITAPVANGQPISPSDVINLRPGKTMNFTFNSADGNTNNVLSLTSDAASVLLGAVFNKTTVSNPSGTIIWTPTAADVRSQPYYFHLTVMDNACPVKGYQTHTYAVRVSNTGAVTGLKNDAAGQLSFIAFPNPFAQTVSFKVNVTKPASNREIVIYNTLGQEVDRMPLNNQASGEQQVVWEYSAKIPNGQYIARLVEGREVTQTIQFSKMQ